MEVKGLGLRLLPAAVDSVVSQDPNVGARVGVDLATELAVADVDLPEPSGDLGIGVKRLGPGDLVGEADVAVEHGNS